MHKHREDRERRATKMKESVIILTDTQAGPYKEQSKI